MEDILFFFFNIFDFTIVFDVLLELFFVLFREFEILFIMLDYLTCNFRFVEGFLLIEFGFRLFRFGLINGSFHT